jgi:hypothetical protein
MVCRINSRERDAEANNRAGVGQIAIYATAAGSKQNFSDCALASSSADACRPGLAADHPALCAELLNSFIISFGFGSRFQLHMCFPSPTVSDTKNPPNQSKATSEIGNFLKNSVQNEKYFKSQAAYSKYVTSRPKIL